MGIYTTILLLSLNWAGTTSANKTYLIYKGDDILGTIDANKAWVNDSLQYTVTSQVSYHSLLYNMERSTLTEVSFCKNILCSSKAFIKKNGETEEDCSTAMRNNIYYCKATNGAVTKINQKIYWCTSMMYFKEPVNATLVFAEAYQELCPIVATDKPHVYELTLPGNKKNLYTYKGGVLTEVKVQRTLVSLTFKLKS